MALGAALLILGLPRLVAALILVSGQPVMDALELGRDVGDDDLASFERASQLARRFSGSGRIASFLAAAKIAEADRLPANAARERAKLAGEAIALLEEGLAKAPADSFAWGRLAYARVLRDGPDAKAGEAWRLSVLTAPADRRLVPWRARLGIAVLPGLADEDRDMLDRQIRLAWLTDGEGLARFARDAGPETVNIVRAALLDQEEDLQKFDALVAY